jgi:cyclohexa-1,5-dienecarbonyl-CoA hydratase
MHIENRNQRVQLKVADQVARIQLTNPPLNIIDFPMMDALRVALREVEARDDVTVILLSGSEKAFSAGVDIPSHQSETIDEMLRRFHHVIAALVSSQKVTIAQVRGACLGGGAELAMVCDFVFSTRDASWGFPEIKLGCYPPVATVALSSLVGRKRATELILTGRQISGEEALAIGLATGAAHSDELYSVVEDTIVRVRELSPAALKITKKACYAWNAMEFEHDLSHAEEIYRNELMKTEDAQEGIRAWMEKRPPKWSGR